MKGHFTFALIIATILLAGSCYLASCTYENEVDLYGTACDTAAVSYKNMVAPVISQNCSSCHATGSLATNKPMDSYTLIRAYAENGSLGHSIRNTGGYDQMPPSAPLSSCELRIIEKWIEAGYPDN